MISTRDLEWAAGFLEGEGSFIHVARKTQRSEHPTWTTGVFYVQAPQVEREPLERLKRLFGGGIWLKTTKKARLDHPDWKTVYYWQTTGARARGIAMTLYSLMSTKRKSQIKKMLSNTWRTRGSRKGNK